MADVNKKLIGTGLIGAAAIAASLLIVPFEGERKVTYQDPPGIQTICYGRTGGVTINQVATHDQCLVYLGEDTRTADAAVTSLVTVKLSDKTKAAFISFVYNVGKEKFRHSTMLKKLNNDDTTGACMELLKWVYAGGVVLPGLVRRREAEKNLCLSGIE